MFLRSLQSREVTAVKEALADHVILSGFERFWELVRGDWDDEQANG